MDREQVKLLIDCSTKVEQADRILEEYCGFKTIQEKVAFLKGMYDVSVVGHEHDKPDKNTYRMMLHTIINEKWM